MKRIILVALSIAIAGTFAIAQAQEDASAPDCDHYETAEGECCCDGTVDGCTEDCDSCEERDCDCEEDCTCDTDCSCDDCTCEEDDEEEVHRCGDCH